LQENFNCYILLKNQLQGGQLRFSYNTDIPRLVSD